MPIQQLVRVHACVISLFQFFGRFFSTLQWRIQKFWKGEGRNNVSAQSSFVADAHNELYAFIWEKRFIEKNCEPIRGGGASTPSPSWIRRWTLPPHAKLPEWRAATSRLPITTLGNCRVSNTERFLLSISFFPDNKAVWWLKSRECASSYKSTHEISFC